MPDRNAIYGNLSTKARYEPGYILLTVMQLDLASGLASRSFTTNEDAYPTSGTKPIIETDWFEKVVINQKAFLANHPDDMGDQFPDLDVIKSLGCGSIANVPVIRNRQTVAVINVLHKAGYFSPKRFEQACALAEFL
jgi:hypothetical protein